MKVLQLFNKMRHRFETYKALGRQVILKNICVKKVV